MVHDSNMEKDSENMTNHALSLRLKMAFERKVQKEKAAGRKYTKAFFALRMGQTRQAIQQWMRLGSIDKWKLLALARELEVSIDWLLTGSYEFDKVIVTTPRVRALTELFQQLSPEDQETIYQEMLAMDRRKREKIDSLFNLK
jgi:Helix-turn-helix.